MDKNGQKMWLGPCYGQEWPKNVVRSVCREVIHTAKMKILQESCSPYAEYMHVLIGVQSLQYMHVLYRGM
jgi:hypothetical protein